MRHTDKETAEDLRYKDFEHNSLKIQPYGHAADLQPNPSSGSRFPSFNRVKLHHYYITTF